MPPRKRGVAATKEDAAKENADPGTGGKASDAAAAREALAFVMDKKNPAADAARSLDVAAGSLRLAVKQQQAGLASFAELELEKLLYHLVASACARGLHTLVHEGVDLLRAVVVVLGPAGSSFQCPAPGAACSADLARLISGALLNGIRSLLAESKDAPAV